MEVKIKYFCCEDKIIVRVIEEDNNYIDTLEYYNPKIEGWIPNKEWYQDMFVDKVVNFREISKNEALKYIDQSVEYYKRVVGIPIYLRRIYGLDLEYLNVNTGQWQDITNQEWYDQIDEYQKISKEEVEKFRDNLFTKKLIKKTS